MKRAIRHPWRNVKATIGPAVKNYAQPRQSFADHRIKNGASKAACSMTITSNWVILNFSIYVNSKHGDSK